MKGKTKSMKKFMKVLLLAVLPASLVMSCTKTTDTGNKSTPSASSPTNPATPTIPSSTPASPTTSKAPTFDELSKKDQKDYIVDLLSPYATQVVSSLHGVEEDESSATISGETKTEYTKYEYDGKLYNVTVSSTILMEKTGTMQTGETSALAETYTYESQTYHTTDKLYTLDKLTTGGVVEEEVEKKKTEDDWPTEDGSGISFNYVINIYQQFEYVYKTYEAMNLLQADSMKLNFTCVEGSTLKISYTFGAKDSTDNDMTFSFELAFADDKVSSIDVKGTSKSVVTDPDDPTSSYSSTSVASAKYTNIKYETITEFAGTLFDPSEFTSEDEGGEDEGTGGEDVSE